MVRFHGIGKKLPGVQTKETGPYGGAVHLGESLEIYLDNNATTMPFPEAVEAVVKAMSEGFGNPSSPHHRGGQAKALLRDARDAVSSLAGCDPEGLVLTSGGTESNNLVFTSLLRRVPNPRIAVSAGEHPSVMRPAQEACSDGRLAVLPLRADGVIDLDALSAELERGADLVSVQWASGETGVVQPISDIARLCRAKGVALHSDAAQALGRIPIRIDQSGADLVTLSAHKVHGPIGIGALWARRKGLLAASMLGGGQQGGTRSGTENVPGAAGFAAACAVRESRFEGDVGRMRHLRDRFEHAVLQAVPDVAVNGAGAERLCNTSSLRFSGVDGQALVANLDRVGIMCSQTSACSSGRPEPSATLVAMGLTAEQAWSTVRFSFSVMNSDEDADTAARAVTDTAAKLRSFMVMA